MLRRYEISSRESAKRADEWTAYQSDKIARARAALEKPPPGERSGADTIALTCALGYLDLRFDGAWRKEHPRFVDWLDVFAEATPSFEATLVRGKRRRNHRGGAKIAAIYRSRKSMRRSGLGSKSPDDWRFFVLNLKAGSPVIKGDRNCIMTQPGLAAHAIYGPYQRLAVGNYAVEFNIAAADGQPFDKEGVCAVVDVASEFGRSILASREVLLSQLRDGPLSICLDFNVARPETFEFRVAVTGSASLLIEDVPPISTDLAADKDPWVELAKAAQTRKDALCAFGPNAYGILTDTPNGLFAVDPEDGGVSAYLLRDGSYMDEECKLAQTVIPTDGDVLVVGAHIGAHAIRLAKACGTLVAVEANPKTFRFLSANLALNNCSNVEAFNVAAAEKEGKIEFLLSRANSGGSKRAPTKMYVHYAYDSPELINVDCVSLDSLLGRRKFDLIMMDIEGSEYFALRGMQGILSASQALSIEFLPHHINDVANVSIDEFIGTFLPHFEWMYVPKYNKIVDKPAIAGVIIEMYHAKDGHDFLYFMKQLNENWPKNYMC